jgi:hypothetical protein
MRSCTLFVAAMILALTTFSPQLPASPLPVEIVENKPSSLDGAFWHIRRGMTDEELFALMAPFERHFTEHDQWQSWTDGGLVVHVTLLVDWNGAGSNRVETASLSKKTPKGLQPLSGGPLTLTPKKNARIWDGRLGLKR